MTTGIETLRPIVGLRPPRRRVARAVARELRETAEPLILSIKNPEDIKKAVAMAAKGEPIAFAGGDIYGLGGLAAAFEKLKEIKKRDYRQKPPVALATWETIEGLVAWEEMAPVNLVPELRKRVAETWKQMPVHFILPLNRKGKAKLPFALKTEDGVAANHAFMGVEGLPKMVSFVQQLEQKTGGVFLVSSANKPGEEPYTTSDQVAENLKGLKAILKDPELDSRTSADSFRGTSYSMFDLGKLGEGIIRIRRAGGIWPLNLDQTLRVDGIVPKLDGNSLTLPDILTPFPSLVKIETSSLR